MIANLPPAPINIGQTYMTSVLQRLTALFARVVVTDQAAPRIILQSPDGRGWNVTVDDTGALTTTLNPGGRTP
jgi:hypothetical protein